MAIQDGKDCRNWLKNKEDHMAIKEKRRMLKFKLHVFTSALRKEKENYKKLRDNTEQRKKTYKPQYDTREELDQAYALGALTDREYMKNRSAIWQVYSDRGHIKNIEWLESEVQRYQDALEYLDQWMKTRHLDTIKRNQHEVNVVRRGRRHNKLRMRRVRAVATAERKARELAEWREKERIEMEEAEIRKEEERRQMEIESEEYFSRYDD